MQSDLISATHQALQAGRLRDAELYCRRALAEHPSNPAILHLLGVVVGQTGKHDVAADLMRQAVRFAPQHVNYRQNLATALMTLGELDEAAEALEVALGILPEDPSLLARLGVVWGMQGKTDEAIELLEQLIERTPNSAVARFNLGELYRRRGDTDAAVEQFQKVLELDANHASALNNLSGLLLNRGDFADALRCIQKQLEVQPRSAQAYCNLGTAMRAAGDLPQALTSYRNAMTLDPEFKAPRFHLAQMLIGSGELDEAEQLMKELREIAPDDVVLRIVHARILERGGDLEGAAELMSGIGDEGALRADVAMMKANVEDQLGNTEEAASLLERVVDSNETVAIDGIGIRFALGQYYDALGRYDEAFECYRIGNDNRREAFVVQFSPEAHERMQETYMQTYSPEHFQSIPTSGLETRLPIFIVGMPRSGTSLMEQILSSHADVHGCGELRTFAKIVQDTYGDANRESRAFNLIEHDPSGNLNCIVPRDWNKVTADRLRDLAEQYLAEVRSMGGDAKRTTDKMPYNFQMVPLIHLVFPQATIIHCRRHPLDTCLSCYFQNFFGGNQYSTDLEHLGIYCRGYLRLMSYWRDTLRIPMLEVHYEDVVANLEPEVRRILKACGLDWDPNCLKFHKSKRVVSTASYQQVRKPLYTKSAGRWRHYEKHLGPMIEALGVDVAQLQTASPELDVAQLQTASAEL